MSNYNYTYPASPFSYAGLGQGYTGEISGPIEAAPSPQHVDETANDLELLKKEVARLRTLAKDQQQCIDELYGMIENLKTGSRHGYQQVVGYWDEP